MSTLDLPVYVIVGKDLVVDEDSVVCDEMETGDVLEVFKDLVFYCDVEVDVEVVTSFIVSVDNGSDVITVEVGGIVEVTVVVEAGEVSEISKSENGGVIFSIVSVNVIVEAMRFLRLWMLMAA